jgi:solute carrier family 12 (potassium/chloride transporters), member 9
VKIGVFRELYGSISTDYDAFEDYFKLTKVKAFVDIAIAGTVRVGVQNLVTNSGLGGMRPNTVILGMYESQQKPIENEITGYSKKVTEKIREKIKNFSQIRDSENPNLSEIEYIQILKDCQISKKHIAIARQYVVYLFEILVSMILINRN